MQKRIGFKHGFLIILFHPEMAFFLPGWFFVPLPLSPVVCCFLQGFFVILDCCFLLLVVLVLVVFLGTVFFGAGTDEFAFVLCLDV